MTSDSLRAVDANALLRYVLNDLPEQAEKARNLVESGQPLGITAVALAEIAWTLGAAQYRRPRAEVATALITLLALENLVPLGFDKREAQASLMACLSDKGAADLGDALISACARSAGVREIYSFDKRFLRTGLTPLPPP